MRKIKLLTDIHEHGRERKCTTGETYRATQVYSNGKQRRGAFGNKDWDLVQDNKRKD